MSEDTDVLAGHAASDAGSRILDNAVPVVDGEVIVRTTMATTTASPPSDQTIAPRGRRTLSSEIDARTDSASSMLDAIPG